MVVCERMPIYLGYIICSLLVAFGIFAYDVAGINTTVSSAQPVPRPTIWAATSFSPL